MEQTVNDNDNRKLYTEPLTNFKHCTVILTV